MEPDKIQAQAGLPLDNAPDAYITALLVPKGGAIVTDRAALEAIGHQVMTGSTKRIMQQLAHLMMARRLISPMWLKEM